MSKKVVPLNKPIPQPAMSQATDPAYLSSIAREINECLKEAVDARLKAALLLCEAKIVCRKAGVPFKAWVERNVAQSYHECVRLAKIGAADDPKHALEDLRARTRASVKKTKDKVALASATPRPKNKTAWQAAVDAIDQLEPQARHNLVASLSAADRRVQERDHVVEQQEVDLGDDVLASCGAAVERAVMAALRELPSKDWPGLFRHLRGVINDIDEREIDEADPAAGCQQGGAR